jgi:hypothetical protein
MRIPMPLTLCGKKAGAISLKLLTLGVVSHSGVERTVDFLKKAEATTPNSVFSSMHHYGPRLLYLHFGFVRGNAVKQRSTYRTSLHLFSVNVAPRATAAARV